ncbi:diguanylate cyclase domain-containing protein [Falsiroseomonas sp.]|uniref:sensor domain-containing diguanylate cyclase n=1 Tax=Falsiroseomonas sp. TaxID=2870721 RepID=UPI003564695F
MSADPDEMLATALLDSRTRWRDLALLSADVLFETDPSGRLTFLAPERPLGHDAAAWVGRPAAELRAFTDTPDPFDPAAPPRGLRSWLLRADGSHSCLEFTAFPVAGGLRGSARDVTEEERRAEATARTLRRATALVRLLGAAQRSRSAGGVTAGALARLLDGIGPALGCTGAMLLEASEGGWRVIATAGQPGPLPADPTPPDGMPRYEGTLALVPATPALLLAAWRDPPPDAEDLGVLVALGAPLAALHGEATRQSELDRAARTDPLTGLLNRRGFAEALADGRATQPVGVLAYLDMDGLKRLNDRQGHAAGDAAIQAMAARLLAAAAKQGVAARLGGDEFALWLPDVAMAEAQQRTAPIGAPGPLDGHPEAGEAAIAASIGLAAAEPEEETEALIARADAAMYARKRARKSA